MDENKLSNTGFSKFKCIVECQPNVFSYQKKQINISFIYELEHGSLAKLMMSNVAVAPRSSTHDKQPTKQHFSYSIAIQTTDINNNQIEKNAETWPTTAINWINLACSTRTLYKLFHSFYLLFFIYCCPVLIEKVK